MHAVVGIRPVFFFFFTQRATGRQTFAHGLIKVFTAKAIVDCNMIVIALI